MAEVSVPWLMDALRGSQFQKPMFKRIWIVVAPARARSLSRARKQIKARCNPGFSKVRHSERRFPSWYAMKMRDRTPIAKWKRLIARLMLITPIRQNMEFGIGKAVD